MGNAGGNEPVNFGDHVLPPILVTEELIGVLSAGMTCGQGRMSPGNELASELWGNIHEIGKAGFQRIV